MAQYFNYRDLKVGWVRNPANDDIVDIFKDYQVTVAKSSAPLVILRTEYVTGTSWTYRQGDMITDFGSDAPRSIIVTVRERDTFLRLSPALSDTLINLTPTTPTFSLRPNFTSVDINIQPIDNKDLAGYMVFRSTSAGFTASTGNRVYKGPAPFYVDSGLVEDTVYYYKVAAYDVFDDTVGNLNVSGALSTTTSNVTGKVVDYQFLGLNFTPNSPSANSVAWTAGSAAKTKGETLNIYGFAAGNALWTSGTLYVYFDEDTTEIETTTNLAVALGNERRIVVASYKGGTELVDGTNQVIMDGSKIIAGTIGANQLVTGSAVITGTAQIANAVIETANIKDLAVGETKIANDAITTNKIFASAISAGKIAANAVTTDKIEALAITTEKLAVGSVTADQVFAGALEAEMIGSGKMNARFLEVTENLSIDALDAGFSMGKNSPSDFDVDGLYMGRSATSGGATGFGFLMGKVQGGVQQYIQHTTDDGLSIVNAQYGILTSVSIADQTITTSQTVTLTPGIAKISLTILGGGGGGENSLLANGTNGGNTVVQLWNGATNTGISWTANGGAQGSAATDAGESSVLGVGATTGRYGVAASGYGSGGSGGVESRTRFGKGGKASIANIINNFNVSAYANPKLVITIGAKGLGNTSPRAGTNGTAGVVKVSQSTLEVVDAGVIPLAATSSGTFSKAANATGGTVFPNLGTGLWVISENSGNPLCLDSLEVDTSGRTIKLANANSATFVANKRPNIITGNATARTIRYSFHRMKV